MIAGFTPWLRGVAVIKMLALGIGFAVVFQHSTIAQTYVIETNDPSRAYNGTTLFPNHDSGRPAVVQIDMRGRIVWEYVIPTNWQSTGPGFDAELLTNGNILIVLPRKGIIEVNRAGDILWSNMDSRVSHDADRLPNGDTLYVLGDDDDPTEAVVKIVNESGSNVWSWYATNEYNIAPYFPYTNVTREGWTHCNAATRKDNGDTMISLRNFNLTVVVDTNGVTKWSMDYTNLYRGSFPIGYDPHEPELVSSNRILVCLQRSAPYQAVEYDINAKTSIWEYAHPSLRTTRDADRLPNGNTLIVAVNSQLENSVMLEVTESKEIVWQLRLDGLSTSNKPGWFFKAQRVIDNDQDGYQDLLDPDDDNDGMTDVDEAIAGTDPMNSNEVLKVRDIVDLPGTNGVRIRWRTETGRTYRVYANTDLLGAWPTGSMHTIPGNGALRSYIDTNSIQRFYRLGVTWP